MVQTENGHNTDNDHVAIINRYAILDIPRIAIEAVGLGTWVIDVETRIFIPSQRMKELFGYHPDEDMSYEGFLNQIVDKYRDKVAAGIEATIVKDEPFSMEYPLTRFHDQKRRWVRAVGALNKTPTDNLYYFSGVIMDITEQKQTHLRKTKFIDMVSHELKTPLTTLKAYVQMLNSWAKKRKDSFTMGTLSKVERQVKKMSAMINGFLNLSQVDSGKIQLIKENFSLDDLIKEIIEESKLITPGCIITLSHCKSIIVNADRDKIDQVIINLITNAIKYSGKDMPIEISCKSAADMIVVSVKDQGMGIKKKDQGKLFRRYYRVTSEKTKKIPGFGIGLYLSAEIIKHHKGKLWVESEEGKGSTFFFSLPTNVT